MIRLRRRPDPDLYPVARQQGAAVKTLSELVQALVQMEMWLAAAAGHTPVGPGRLRRLAQVALVEVQSVQVQLLERAGYRVTPPPATARTSRPRQGRP